jgi:hypothetical protein
MISWKVWFASLLAGGAVTLAILGGSPGAGANPARPAIPIHPPAVPRIVEGDGRLNLALVTHIPVWEPPSYRGPERFAPASSFAQNLTPAEIAHLSGAQRLTAHVGVTP